MTEAAEAAGEDPCKPSSPSPSRARSVSTIIAPLPPPSRISCAALQVSPPSSATLPVPVPITFALSLLSGTVEAARMVGMETVNATLALIPQYTGLSTGTFFTIVALVFGIYFLLSGLLAPAQIKFVPAPPLPAPTQLGEISAEELQTFDGTDVNKPLLMAIKGQIYDVSQSRAFYGPGGPYALFAGKDASRALAKMSFEEKDLTGDVEGLSEYESEALTDWEYKFMSKYVKVGTVKPGAPKSSEEVPAESSEDKTPVADDERSSENLSQ